MRRSAGIVLLISLACGSRHARADDAAGAGTAREQASNLHQEAERALKAGDWDAACLLYEQSEALDASATTQARIAQCFEHRGELVRALAAYEEASRLVDRLDPERRKRASEIFPEQIAALAARIPSLRLDVALPRDGLLVELDGRALRKDELPVPLRIDPGRHVVRASGPGLRATECELEAIEGRHPQARLEPASAGSAACILEGERLTMSVPKGEPLAVAAAPVAGVHAEKAAPQPAGNATARKPKEDHTTQRTIGWAVGAAGVVALGTATYFGIHTLSLVDGADCNAQNQCSPAGISTMESARSSQTTAFVLAGVGAAFVAAGVTLVLLGHEARSSHTVGVHVTPGGGALVVTW